MRVTLDDVRQAFDDVESGRRTREEMNDWAWAAMQANDLGELEFEPRSEMGRIWAAITYLHGFDLEESPGVYLHVLEDLADERRRLGL